MSSLPPNLRTAIDAYRELVLDQNVAIISTVVSKLENQASLQNSRLNPPRPNTEVQEAVLQTLTKLLGTDLPSSSSISRARDLLEADNRALLANHFELDGVSRGNIDLEKRQNWLATVGTELGRLREESDRSEGQWPEALPSELQSLITNIHGIMRPGLPNDREYFGTDFFDWHIDLERDEAIRKHAFLPSPSDVYPMPMDMVWPGWDVAAAVQLHKAEMRPTTAIALFCIDEQEPSEWAWRFGICDEAWGSELFDNVEQFLTWFATYGVPTEEDIQGDNDLLMIDWKAEELVVDVM